MSDEELLHAFDNPALAGLPDLAKAQVVQQINCQLIGELLAAAGGEVVLPPGFGDRVGAARHVVMTRFLPDGSYRVWTVPITPELNEPANATMWERMAGPQRSSEREVYGVAGVEPGDPYTTLSRIDAVTGAAIDGRPLLRVQSDYLRRGVGGWRRFKPSAEQVVASAGREL